MRPNVSTITTQGDLGGQKVAMSFDANSLAHIMSVLTDLYSDPELAIIREYSTNAYDSHIAAGVDQPIEISLPNHLSTYFKVKDYGLGLDADDIVNIYSKYGASTKRDTNSQTGMLGLGCKSALTYTNQFILTGIKDGTKTSVSISRSADGSGTMEIMGSSSTNEPNGVEVVIPANNTAAFHRKAKDFFKHWPKNSVLIDGQSPQDYEKISLNNYIDITLNSKIDVVVMGNVAYPVDGKIEVRNKNGYSSHWRSYGFVIHVEMGEVDFTPSREKLHFTKKTEAKIQEIIKDIHENLPLVLQREIDKAGSHKEALEVYKKWSQVLDTSLQKIVYNGDELPVYFPIDYSYDLSSFKFAKIANRNGGILSTQMGPSVIFIYNYKEEKHTPHKKKKIRKWVEGLEDKYYTIFLREEKPPAKWFDDIVQVDWEEIKKITFPKSPTKKNPELVYNKLNHRGGVDKVTELDSVKETVYFFANEFTSVPKREAIANYFWANYNIVSISSVGNAHSKFIKANPNAKTIISMLDNDYNTLIGSLNKSQIRWIFENGQHSFYNHADASRVDDPEIKEAITQKISSADMSRTVAKFEKIRSAYSNIYGKYIGRPKSDAEDPLEAYSLMSAIQPYSCHRVMDELYLYLNAAYKERQNKTL